MIAIGPFIAGVKKSTAFELVYCFFIVLSHSNPHAICSYCKPLFYSPEDRGCIWKIECYDQLSGGVEREKNCISPE